MRMHRICMDYVALDYALLASLKDLSGSENSSEAGILEGKVRNDNINQLRKVEVAFVRK